MKFLWILLAILSCSVKELFSHEFELLSFAKLPESDPEFCDLGTLRMKKRGRNKFVIDGDFVYKKSFADEIDGILEIMDSDHKPVFFAKNSLCKMLKTDYVIWPEVMKHSNLTRNCPIVKGPYYIKDYEVELKNIPPAFKAGVYHAKVYFAEKGVLKAGITLETMFKK